MLIGSNVSNFGQFVYHFIFGRMLGPVYYGDLVALVSIIGIVGIVQLSIGLTIVKFISSSKNDNEIANLVHWFNTWAVWLGGIGALVILALSPWFTNFLHLHQPKSFYIMVPVFFGMVLVFTQRSILQGLLKFNKYVISLILEVIVKISFGFVFVLFGFLVFGAMLGILASILLSLVFTYWCIIPLLKTKKEKAPNILPLLKYSLPVFFQGVALTSIYSTDVLLVKHFFTAQEAGIYSSLAVLGRVVFFSSSPIAQVMFPLISKRFSHGESYHKVFYLSVFFVILISIPAILFYLVFPEFIINLLYGSEFIEGSGLLWWFGIFMGLLGISNLFVQFYLSINKTRVVLFFVAAAILQFSLIWFIHTDILKVIQLSIISVGLLVVSLVVYFPYHNSHILKKKQ